jgi:hypothetical protein
VLRLEGVNAIYTIKGIPNEEACFLLKMPMMLWCFHPFALRQQFLPERQLVVAVHLKKLWDQIFWSGFKVLFVR